MRLVVALVMTCAAVVALVLRDRGETVPASEQVVAVDRPVCAPPVLTGTAPRLETTAVDVDHPTDSGNELIADSVEDLRARSWTIEVVDAVGGEVAPHGLIEVYFEPEGNLPERRSVESSRTDVLLAEPPSRVSVARNFPLGTGQLIEPDHDVVQVSLRQQRVTVSLRGWQPYIVDFPEVPPLPNEARGTIWDYTRLEFSNGRRVSFKARPFDAHAIPIPTGVTIDVATWQRTTMESGTLRVDEASNLLRRD